MTRGLATLDDAIEWLRDNWQPREVPVRLHRFAYEGWGPFFTLAFARYLGARPGDTEEASETRTCNHVRNVSPSVWECPDCQGVGVYEARTLRYRNPMWRAMERLSAYDRANSPRPGMPAMTEIILGLVVSGYEARALAEALIPSTGRGQWEVGEPLILLAVRRLYQRYEEGPVETGWVSKSEAQRNAEVAA